MEQAPRLLQKRFSTLTLVRANLNFTAVMLIDRRFLAHFDFKLLGMSMLIPICGLVVLYSAGFDADYPGIKFFNFTFYSAPFFKQAVYLTFALIALVLSLLLSPSFYFRGAYVFWSLTVILLCYVLFDGISVNGSRRWLEILQIRIQPSELAKLSVVLVLARRLARREDISKPIGFRELLSHSLFIFVPMFLTIQQPDLGTAVAIGAIGFGMLLFCGIKRNVLVWLTIVSILAVVPIWNLYLHPYQKNRILALFSPEMDPLGSGYHLIQSKIAVGSGMLLGKGFMKGTQTQLEFLPEHTTDFVFSVLAEEWGFVGCLLIIALYWVLLWQMIKTCAKMREHFQLYAIIGIITMLFFHTAVNIAMVIGLLPVVGITLPLFSYGGSSLITFMLAIGLTLNFSMRRFEMSTTE